MNTASSREQLGSLQWQEHRSMHFVFWFMPGSQAEKNVTALASNLETIRSATVNALALEDLPL